MTSTVHDGTQNQTSGLSKHGFHIQPFKWFFFKMLPLYIEILYIYMYTKCAHGVNCQEKLHWASN